MKLLTTGLLDDWVEAFAWRKDSQALLLTPTQGNTLEYSLSSSTLPRTFPGYGMNNGAAVYGPNDEICQPCGDGAIRIFRSEQDPQKIAIGREWISAVRWSPNGRHFATTYRKSILIFDAKGNQVEEFAEHKSSICDFCWNPHSPYQIVAVGDGGAKMWRIGKKAPLGHFDWGGASIFVTWSPDGRWVVTGDLTPSVHLYDFTRNYPLHIQGYETKVRSLSFDSTSEKLATAGGVTVIVWDCTGKEGPEGSVPLQLEGHTKNCTVVRFSPSGVLATGGQDGRVLLFEFETSTSPKLFENCHSAVTCIEWSPDGKKLAVGTEDGKYRIYEK